MGAGGVKIFKITGTRFPGGSQSKEQFSNSLNSLQHKWLIQTAHKPISVNSEETPWSQRRQAKGFFNQFSENSHSKSRGQRLKNLALFQRDHPCFQSNRPQEKQHLFQREKTKGQPLLGKQSDLSEIRLGVSTCIKTKSFTRKMKSLNRKKKKKKQTFQWRASMAERMGTHIQKKNLLSCNNTLRTLQ